MGLGHIPNKRILTEGEPIRSVSRSHPAVTGTHSSARFSGGTRGFCIGHVAPEAADGGTIAILRNGDVVSIDVKKRRLDVELSAAEIKRRQRAAKAPRTRYRTGALAKYARLVSSASDGAVTS